MVLTVVSSKGAWDAEITWPSGHKLSRQFRTLDQAKAWADRAAHLDDREEGTS